VVIAGGHGLFNLDDPTSRLYKSDRSSIPLSTVIGFDTARPERGWFDLPPVPGTGRQSPAVTAIGRKVYVFGGAYYKTWVDGEGSPLELCFYGDAYVLDLDRMQWRQLPDLPVPAWGMGAAPWGNHSIVLFGGDTSGRVEHPYRYAARWQGVARPNSEVFVFDTELEHYRALPTPLPLIPLSEEYRRELGERRAKEPSTKLQYRYDHSRGIRRNNARVSVIRDRLYVLGGVTGVGERTAHAVGELLVGTVQH
jgi:N-acetylneuraminic acid mutarotase